MEDYPLVSIIVPVFNGERHICETLDTAIFQSYKNIEIIVVNDGSLDKTINILNKYGNKIKVVNQENLGIRMARNVGVDNSKGEFIAFLDQDDLFDINKTQKQVEIFSLFSDVDVVCSDARLINENSEVIRNKIIGEKIKNFQFNTMDFIKNNRILTLTVMIRRSAFQRVGGFYDKDRSLGEDYELWLDLSAEKCKFFFIEDALASYRIHSGNTSKNKYLVHSGEVNVLRRFEKNKKNITIFEKIIIRLRIMNLYYDMAWHCAKRGEFCDARKNYYFSIIYGIPTFKNIFQLIRHLFVGKTY